MASYEENKKLREQAKKANEERYRESSKKRLIKNLERKFKTTNRSEFFGSKRRD